ncbi:NTPase KAP [Caulobacter sp. Root487D2Y]|uniref:KAP family P-loop NTPase fold protein n=1 Tax=Caulobacter sp. Root487D2Y TaxID=1736547 RepID=UPI0006F947DF|nr:P-loop NTPase fold protein [Caulobacter sp. Root487D2Y]KQY26155.1 NTPase KAP [Caulobacter sp. Root487D2Y]
MWADAETDTDYLNYSEIAELVTELITDPDLLPISLGVFGGWGTGKSSTLKLIQSQLATLAEPPIVVEFDAWLYQDFDDARAALMSVIARTLYASAPESLKDKATGLIKRVNKLRLLGLAVEAGAFALGVPTFGVAARGVEALGDIARSSADEEDVKAIKATTSDARERVKDLMGPKTDRTPPDEIDAFRREFGDLLASIDRQLVVFIDNLDRCLPSNAIHTLEAVRLFLFIPRTAFVVAADEDMIRHAVSQHFSNPAERHVSDYLDKLIQVPVRVPRVGVQEVRAYLFMLLASRAKVDSDALEGLRNQLISRLQQAWQSDEIVTVDAALKRLGRSADEGLRRSFEMADRMAPLLAKSTRVSGNPRIVKRLLNVVRMRSSIAKRRSMPLDEAVIAKLALFERCTDETASLALHTLINQAEGGKPDALRRIESNKSVSDRDALPEAWSKHLAFIKDWAGLEPLLAGVDLRPAVYLARETVPLQISSSSASAAVVAAVEVLLKVTTISSPAAREALDAVPPNEYVAVIEAVIAEMRKNSDWGRPRTDFRGATLVATRSPEAGSLLARFIRSLQLSRPPAWMSTMIKDADWWKGTAK